MSKKNEKNSIKKENWLASFTLVGTPKISDYTFKIDEKSEKSNWIYNSMNLGIDCGEKHGVVYAEMMGGYSGENAGVIYAHGKKDDGTDDWDSQMEIDWDDRLNEDILETVGDACFVTVGLEKTNKDKTFYKRFLSQYDAIAYIKEYLTEDMVVRVRGQLRYSEYQDKVQTHKNINSIVVSKVDDPSKYCANFTQTVLIDKNSASLKGDNIDKDKGVMYVNTKVLDYVKEKNGVEIKGQYPFNKQFEFAMDFTSQEKCKKIMEKLFKVRRGYTQVTFEGDFIEGGATVTATMDDVPDDIKELIEIGVYTEEEALARCSVNGSREQRMILTRPYIRLEGEEKIPVIQRFEEKYTEEDLYVDLGNNDSNNNEDEDEEVDDSNTESSDASSMDWLNSL